MGLEKIILILACACGALAFTCPDDSHSFYHADVSTGCTVYHFCENSQLSTLTCPAGEAFNHATSKCEDASTVSCIETMGHHNMHHHHRRSIEEQPHAIDIQQAKTRVVDLYREIKPLVTSAIKDIAPSMYAKFEADYLPSIKKLQNETMPYFYDKVWPRVKKSVAYAKHMAGRLFKKASESYELSNSTHIAIVSFYDIANDIAKDLKPYIELGRYMTARLVQHTRAKRSTMHSEMPDIVYDFMEPVVADVFNSIDGTVTGQGNTVTSKVILPIYYNMTNDPETRFDLKRVFYSAKAAFSPVLWEMLNKQVFNTTDGTVINIHRSTFDEAVSRFNTETKPIIHKILNKHLSMMLFLTSQNVPLIMESIESLEDVKKYHSVALKDAILKFITKHGALIQTSDSKFINTYTLTEIKKDIEPIYVPFLRIYFEYFSKNKHPLMNMVFSRDSYLYKSLLGKPVYPKPSS